MKGFPGTALAISLAAAAPALAYSGMNALQQPDKNFLTKAKDNISEIKFGELAAHKANMPQLKQFARRMVDDRTRRRTSLAEIMNLDCDRP